MPRYGIAEQLPCAEEYNSCEIPAVGPENSMVPKEVLMLVADRIEIDPAVMLGKPVIRGTRITFELILRKLSEGAAVEDLLDAYPRLAR